MLIRLTRELVPLGPWLEKRVRQPRFFKLSSSLSLSSPGHPFIFFYNHPLPPPLPASPISGNPQSFVARRNFTPLSSRLAELQLSVEKEQLVSVDRCAATRVAD